MDKQEVTEKMYDKEGDDKSPLAAICGVKVFEGEAKEWKSERPVSNFKAEGFQSSRIILR